MSVLLDSERAKPKGKIIGGLMTAWLVIGLPIQVFPFCWMLLNSFKSTAEITNAHLSLLPSEWLNEAYKLVFERYDLLSNLWNTVYIVGFTLIVQLTVSALAAYSLSKLRPRFGKTVEVFFLGTMMMSGMALMIPTYVMGVNLGFLNNKFTLVFLNSASAYCIMLFKDFFDGIPQDLQEAAVIDGAGRVRIFTSIIAPLSKPIFAVMTIRTIMGVYNDYILPLMFLPDEKNWTIMMRVFKLQEGLSFDLNVMYALLAIVTIPMIIMYLFMQKHIAEGIATTGLKG